MLPGRLCSRRAREPSLWMRRRPAAPDDAGLDGPGPAGRTGWARGQLVRPAPSLPPACCRDVAAPDVLESHAGGCAADPPRRTMRASTGLPERAELDGRTAIWYAAVPDCSSGSVGEVRGEQRIEAKSRVKTF